EVSTGGSTHGSLRIRHVDATFYHVRTSDYFRQATVQVATGSATLPFSDLRSLGLSAGYGGTSADGAGLLSVAPLGSSGPRVKVGVSESQGGGISFVGAGGAGGAGGLLGAAGGAVRSLLGQPYVLSGLPAGLSVDSVQVTKQGITLSLSGRHIILHR
ncbi:MAG: LmeA family phospholipid-binding protein, partial [Sciscionella sp.]